MAQQLGSLKSNVCTQGEGPIPFSGALAGGLYGDRACRAVQGLIKHDYCEEHGGFCKAMQDSATRIMERYACSEDQDCDIDGTPSKAAAPVPCCSDTRQQFEAMCNYINRDLLENMVWFSPCPYVCAVINDEISRRHPHVRACKFSCAQYRIALSLFFPTHSSASSLPVSFLLHHTVFDNHSVCLSWHISAPGPFSEVCAREYHLDDICPAHGACRQTRPAFRAVHVP